MFPSLPLTAPHLKESAYVNRMFEDPIALQALKERWNAVYPRISGSINGFIDQTKMQINKAQIQNYKRYDFGWAFGRMGWTNTPIDLNPQFDFAGIRVTTSHEAEVDYIKNWLTIRLNFLNSEINALP